MNSRLDVLIFLTVDLFFFFNFGRGGEGVMVVRNTKEV